MTQAEKPTTAKLSRRTLLAGGQALRAFPVRGDSMEPMFKRGDFALVVPCDDFMYDHVYVVGLEEPVVCRACRSIGTAISLLWENERSPT